MPKDKKDKSKKVRITKNVKISKAKKKKLEDKPGGSNIGKYKGVKKADFAGPAGGAPQGTYPINTKKRAKAALAYAHNAPNPSGIKKAVYAKYPDLKKDKKK